MHAFRATVEDHNADHAGAEREWQQNASTRNARKSSKHGRPSSYQYLGFIDAVQRSNVITPNVLLQAKPSDKLSLLLWYYHFQAASDASAPSIGGTPPQNAGRHYGDEIDLLAKYKVNARNTVVTGYSHFWKGNKITNTDDADFVYAEWTVNF